MVNVLSQEEVDSLLNGIGEGQVETETDIPETDDGLKRYVFGEEGGPIHLKMPALGIINERFINALNSSLSAATGSIIDVSITDIDSVRYGEFCRSLPLPSSLNIFKMTPLRGFALLVLEGPLVFAFVDTFFGGKNTNQVKLEGKSFTAIEVKIVERVVSIILENLQQAWSDVYAVDLVPTRTEIDSQFAGIATPDDMIIANRFSVDIGNFLGAMTICLPYSTLEPIRDKLRNTFQGENIEVDQRWRRILKKKIRDLDITLNCALGTAKISGREALEMKAGDVIQLEQSPRDSMIVSIEGVPKLRGALGARNNKNAVKIVERISED